MITPAWVITLGDKVIEYWEEKYSVTLPHVYISCRKANRLYSSGVAYTKSNPRLIVLHRGTSRVDGKLVLIHELAHHIANTEKSQDRHHSTRFWEIAWELYRKFKIPIRYARQREESYRKGSKKGYESTKGLNTTVQR